MLIEILLASGCILTILSFVSIVSTRIEGRKPRVAAISVVAGAGLILAASYVSDDGLQVRDVPYAFVSIVAALLN